MTTVLPIDSHLPDILSALRRHRAVVVTAPPGSGKTTRVPPALVNDGRVLLLQPRRVAARAIARRIADERGWTIGREVGWHVRFDKRLSADTRLVVATEGVLTARLQQDPLLSDVRTVVIDEFHERSIHADLGLALARQAWLARDDLRIVVMSATIDAARVAAFLGDCPVIEAPGRVHPLDVRYRPGVSLEDMVVEALPSVDGALLCFLPGAGEIRRASEALTARLSGRGVRVLPLHGGLDADAQDDALQPSPGMRVILATNLAETTVTVPDVAAVIDTGQHKVARYDPDRAIDSLETERITQDSADQRAGRAGRTRAGVAWRLWDARDRLRPHREPDIARVDLAAPALDVLAWGGDPRALEWFERPPDAALDAALEVLRRLGALDARGAVTAIGRDLQRLPLHPRLGRMLLAAHGAPAMARACALLSERHSIPPRHGATPCDLLSAIDRERDLPPHVLRAARDIAASAASMLGASAAASIDDAGFRRAVLAGYPDRVARRRAARSDRFLLTSGTGARLARESGVLDAEFVVATDVTAGPPSFAGDAMIRLATSVDRDWLVPDAIDVVHRFDEASGTVRAASVERYGALTLGEHHVSADPSEAARLLAAVLVARGPSDEAAQLLRRLEFAGLPATFGALVETAVVGQRCLQDVDLESALSAESRRALARDAPATFKAPSGRVVKLDYRDNGMIVGATRLQDLFGLSDSPRIGRRQVPVTFELLAPNGRPVQVTNDLRSFWTTLYPEIRKALSARYPKHRW